MVLAQKHLLPYACVKISRDLDMHAKFLLDAFTPENKKVKGKKV